MLRVRRRKVWNSMTVLGLVAAAAAILLLSASLVSAKGKPPKEEPQDPSPDTGIIYFRSSGTILSMAWDGSNKQSLDLNGYYHVEPSELTHDGERWFLTVDTVEGTYPNGDQRWEIFAVSESGTRVQLTDAPDVEALGAFLENMSGDQRNWFVHYGAHPRWFCDDTKVSYWARRWQDGTVVEGSDDLYEAEVDWATQSPDSTPMDLELNVSWYWEELGGPFYDWSPDDSQLVYTEGGPVYVVSAAGGTPSQITTGYRPEWSPDGARILVHDGGDVYSVATDGSDRTLVVGRSDSKKESLVGATWSPNATHVAYCVKQRRGKLARNVYRANVQGEYETKLTGDLDWDTAVLGWRAE